MADAADLKPAVALITGFPRLVARGLVQRGLNLHPHNRIQLLVAPAHREAAEALRASLAPGQAERLTLLIGQTTDVDLGLAGPDVQRLIEETTHIFHAESEQHGPRSRLQRVNVGGLANVLSTARDLQALQRICVFSTAFVSGDRRGLIREEELDGRQQFNAPFEQTMFAAEQVARAVMPRLPITVLRPSALIGHSRTGEAEGLTEGPNYLVRLMVRLPAEVPFLLPGRGVVPFNIVPVDYVVHAAWVIAQAPEAVGRTFHLTDPNPVSAREACELLGELAANRPAPVRAHWPLRLAGKVLQWTRLDRFAPDQMALLHDLTRQVTYDCSGALELLAHAGVVCPPFEAYADVLVGWVADYERSLRNEPDHLAGA
ncbi:MAG: SDR family oxidoreductase [Myxococcales bacterium]|nr:SDR family oxidoreductase [Myxococcales bacterium]